MEELKITETFIVEKVKEYLVNKERGNWHEEKTKTSELHGHDADIVMTGGSKNGERFIVECKGKSYAKSARSINKEGWLNALGQIIYSYEHKENNKQRCPKREYKPFL